MYVTHYIILFPFFSIVFTKSVSPANEKQPFTLEESVLTKLDQKKFNGIWISDNELEYRDIKTRDINILKADTLKSSVFLANSVIEKYRGISYDVSPDRKFVLIKYGSNSIYGRTTFSKYVVYSISDKAYYNVTNGESIREAQWGPKGNALVYVMKNNLYYLPQITSAMKAQQITNDGERGLIFNGVADWVYADKVLRSGRQFFFSPNGDQLAYVKFNDTPVGEYKITKYGEPGDYKHLYTKDLRQRFPKVGTPNPIHEIWWVDLANSKNRKMLDGSLNQPQKEVFFGLTWLNNSGIVALVTNRVQNESLLIGYSLNRNVSRVMCKRVNSRGWTETEMPKFTVNPSKYVRIVPQPFANDEFDHLTLFTPTENYTLTSGPFEVVEIIDWDRQNKVVYYKATEEGSPSTIQVYRINEAKGSKPYCLTCRIKSPEGRGCKHASAVFSKNFSYVMIQCNGPDPTMTYLFKNENPMKDALTVLDNSADLRAALAKKLMPEVMNFTVPIPGPFQAEVRMYLPPNMDKSGKTKYPLLLHVYGHMGSKQIYDSFKIDLEMYMTTNRSVIYAVADARNTKNKGKNMLFAGYRRIGTTEMEDQITITKYLQKTFNFIDSKRIGLWGWSFGGYATLRILQLDREDIFKCGVAVVPVVDFAYCDTMLAERHMRTLNENKENYVKASLFTSVKSLKRKNFYLVSGVADDGIHYQQHMLLSKLLEQNDIMFKFQSYPDEGHGLMGVRPHLYHSLDNYWRKCLNIQ